MRKINLHKAGRATHQALRDLNEILVLNQVRERQPISRIEIAESTGLEGSTVSKIVTRLLENEFVFENGVGSASPQGGRKKRFLHLNPEKAYAVGVDLGPQSHLIALSDFSGRILRQTTVANSADPQRTLEAVAAAIKKLLQAGLPPNTSRERVAGVGVSLVGLVDTKEGRMLAADSLGWGDDVPVGSLLRQALNPDLPLYFDNGARLAALAEIWLGSDTSRQRQDLVFLEVSEGVGAGIVTQGQLHHGSLNGAGEFGQDGVDVPAAVIDLHKANTAFDQTPGHEATVGKGTAFTRLLAVELVGTLGFFGKVGQLRNRRLHAEGHFELCDADQGFGIADLFVLDPVELA